MIRLLEIGLVNVEFGQRPVDAFKFGNVEIDASPAQLVFQPVDSGYSGNRHNPGFLRQLPGQDDLRLLQVRFQLYFFHCLKPPISIINQKETPVKSPKARMLLLKGDS